MEALKTQLEQEITRRTQAEQSALQNTTELTRFKDRAVKFERDLTKAQSDLHARDWEIKQLKANQNKTIVEHVHVLQEAKKRTDIQLAETQQELLKEQTRVKSLEKTKARLMGEAEDAARQAEKELVALRSKEKNVKSYEEKATKAIADAGREKKLRDATELQTRRLQTELRDTQNQLMEMEQHLKTAERTKDTLEAEISSLATESDGANALAKMRRQYEARISQLESKVENAEIARTTAERIKQKIDQQHAELRRLISSSGPRDDFRERLLKELQQADEAMEREYSSKIPEIPTISNASPAKRQSVDLNGPSRVRRDSQPAEPSRPDAQSAQLQHQLQALELRIVASDRVRQHLEASLRELTADLENSDGSKQSLEKHRAKIARENNRLAQLLNEEAEARRASEASQMDGIQTMWQKFQTTIETERKSYGRLEESRKALVSHRRAWISENRLTTSQLVQQRALQAEVENQKRQMQELNQSKRQLLAEVADLKDHLELEQKGKNEEAGMLS
jgi:myosin protein heavy chain